MYAVRVMPIQRGVFREHLTFFSRENVSEGSIVNVTIRKRSVPALVLSSADVREEKMNLKSADFSLKKIQGTGRRVLSTAFLRATKEAALYHASHEGVALAALTFMPILSEPKKVEEVPSATLRSGDVAPEVLVLQADHSERMSTYKNLTRESFARGQSLMIIAPSLTEVEQLEVALSRGVEESVVVLTGDLPHKRLRDRWNRALTESGPLLIIGTPQALSLPVSNLDTIVIEHEGARAYKGRERPHLDIRRVAESLSRACNVRLILADFPVRIETRFRVEEHTAEDFSRPQVRIQSGASVRAIDTRKTDEMKKERRAFSPLSEESLEAIAEEVGRGGRVLVFAARKGLAPLTVCNDCGTPILDPSTGVPMSLHRTPKGNVFFSHRSGAVLPANISCKNCGGWNLVTLGIGIDRVHDELKKRFPKTPITVFTKETAPAHRAAQALMKGFEQVPGSILLGTERMLPYVAESVELSIIASIDSMLARPEWRAHEYALSILLFIRTRTEHAMIIETRKADSEVIKAAVAGNPADFYRSDIVEREKYGYPPYVTFIGLSWTGTEKECARLRAYVLSMAEGVDLVGPLPPECLDKNRLVERAVIRVPRGEWPNEVLAEKIKTLPPEISITVDPDEIV